MGSFHIFSPVFVVVQCLFLTFVEPSSVLYTKENICKNTASTLKIVESCPPNKQEFLKRSNKKKCDLEPPCLREPLVFHCVRYMNSFAEVCAPRATIKGHCCAEFDKGIGRVREDFSRLCYKCPFKYSSNESTLQSECLKSMPMSKPSTQQTDAISTNNVESARKPCNYRNKRAIPILKRHVACNDINQATLDTTTEQFTTKAFEGDDHLTGKSKKGNKLQESIIVFVFAVVLIFNLALVVTYGIRKNFMKKQTKQEEENKSEPLI